MIGNSKRYTRYHADGVVLARQRSLRQEKQPAGFDVGADSALVLPAGFDINYGPQPILPVLTALPRGTWGYRCAIEDPISGEVYAQDTAEFEIQ